MSDQQVDQGKRVWLIATGCVGAAGGVATAVPFVSTFQPSERAKAAGAAVEADISALKPGEKMTVEWRGKPVWILRRTPEMLKSLDKSNGEVADPASKRTAYPTPEYARNEWRSINKEYLVVIGICTHLGCSPSDKLVPDRSPRCRTPGRAASCAPAMAPPSTWPAACSRTSPRRTTSKCRPTCTCPRPRSSLAKTRRPESPRDSLRLPTAHRMTRHG